MTEHPRVRSSMFVDDIVELYTLNRACLCRQRGSQRTGVYRSHLCVWDLLLLILRFCAPCGSFQCVWPLDSCTIRLHICNVDCRPCDKNSLGFSGLISGVSTTIGRLRPLFLVLDGPQIARMCSEAYATLGQRRSRAKNAESDAPARVLKRRG